MDEDRRRKERLLKDNTVRHVPGTGNREDSGSSSGDSDNGEMADCIVGCRKQLFAQPQMEDFLSLVMGNHLLTKLN